MDAETPSAVAVMRDKTVVIIGYFTITKIN